MKIADITLNTQYQVRPFGFGSATIDEVDVIIVGTVVGIGWGKGGSTARPMPLSDGASPRDLAYGFHPARDGKYVVIRVDEATQRTGPSILLYKGSYKVVHSNKIIGEWTPQRKKDARAASTERFEEAQANQRLRDENRARIAQENQDAMKVLAEIVPPSVLPWWAQDSDVTTTFGRVEGRMGVVDLRAVVEAAYEAGRQSTTTA